MLCNLRVGHSIVESSEPIKRVADTGMQTEPAVLPVLPSTSSSGPRIISAPKVRWPCWETLHPLELQRSLNTTNAASTSSSIPTSSTTKRKRAPATKSTLSKPSSRELRSRNSSSRVCLHTSHSSQVPIIPPELSAG